MLKYRKEVERLERAYQQHINTLWNMASKAKFPLMKRFFETVASRVKHLYDIANRDVEAWLKSVMSPLETQVREHHLQLKRRLDSIKRIHRASDELEERVAELDAAGRGAGRAGARAGRAQSRRSTIVRSRNCRSPPTREWRRSAHARACGPAVARLARSRDAVRRPCCCRYARSLALSLTPSP